MSLKKTAFWAVPLAVPIILALAGAVSSDGFGSPSPGQAAVATAEIQSLPPATVATPSAGPQVRLKYASFDPLMGVPAVPASLAAAPENTIQLIQVQRPLSSWEIESLESAGANLLGFIQDYTYLAHLPAGSLTAVRSLPFVRWVGPYQPAYKILAGLLTCTDDEVELNIEYFTLPEIASGRVAILDRVAAVGGQVTREETIDSIVRARIAPSAIPALASLPAVRWIDRYYPPRKLMNQVRVSAGAEVDQIAGFDGEGIVGEVKDAGIDQDHPDFGNLIGTYSNPGIDPHGTCTFGIVFSDGFTQTEAGQMAKGMMSKGSGVFADWQTGRGESIWNLKDAWNGRFQSNSWGQGDDNGDYTSQSRANDAAINAKDVNVLYSGGNDGLNPGDVSQDGSAKNTICVGAMYSGDDADRSNDYWNRGGAGNTPCQGPAADGRVKPDVTADWDWIFCTDIHGTQGYTPGDYYRYFGGTSGSCPIAAGAIGLIYDMFEDNHFGNNPTNAIPHAATPKAILIANAWQYDFDAATRFQQGWGGVDVGRVHAAARHQLIVDGGHPLATGESWSTAVSRYNAAEPMKIVLVTCDKEGESSATRALINDLDLRVTAPDGTTVYYGNYGLMTSHYSPAGGNFDRINNVECVFIQHPVAGNYTIEVLGFNVPIDNNAADGVNQDFSLAVSMVASATAPQAMILTGPGPDTRNPPRVRLFEAATGTIVQQWSAYGIDDWGVNVAAGDLDGDGLDEVLTGPGPGDVFGPHVRGFTFTGTPYPGVSFIAYGTLKFGANVVAGDLDGDGNDEIVTGAGPGAVFGPHVRGWNYSGGTISALPGVSFLAYGTHKWGVNVACGDLDGDGKAEIVTGAGPGSVFGPHVRGWNNDGAGSTTAIPAVSFLAYGTNQFGVNVACGDLDGDGYDEIITGPGPGVVFGPHVRGWNFDGVSISPLSGVSFFAYDSGLYGARVGALDVDGDGMDEILTMPGPDTDRPPQLRAWNVDGGTATPIGILDFDAYEGMELDFGGKVAGGSF